MTSRRGSKTVTPSPSQHLSHHSTLLERTPRSSFRFASSSSRIILPSFSIAFRVDCISLRLSLFTLALAPTGKHVTRRRRTSRNFSCSFSTLAALSTILLRVHLHHAELLGQRNTPPNRVIEMKFSSSSETSTSITVAGFASGHHGQFCTLHLLSGPKQPRNVYFIVSRTQAAVWPLAKDQNVIFVVKHATVSARPLHNTSISKGLLHVLSDFVASEGVERPCQTHLQMRFRLMMQYFFSLGVGPAYPSYR